MASRDNNYRVRISNEMSVLRVRRLDFVPASSVLNCVFGVSLNRVYIYMHIYAFLIKLTEFKRFTSMLFVAVW